jgi:zinc transport system substrate-binding protein
MPAFPFPSPARLAASLVVVASLGLTGCGSRAAGPATDSTASGDSPRIVAAFYPLQYAAQQVAGDAASVTTLTPPGVEPHDLELTAQQVAQIGEADLVLYVPGFQPAVDEAIAQQAPDQAVDVTAGLTLLAGHDEAGITDPASDAGGPTDPHVWLDPANMASIGQTIATRLADIAPDGASAYEAQGKAFAADMTALGTDLSTSLATCAVHTMVVSHEAFGYLAAAAGLTQVGISGLSPEAEPSPARLREVSDIVAREGVTTIYYETLVDPKVAQTLADETGAAAAVLDPLEGLAPDATGDYTSVMRDNIATLRTGQGCT